MARDEQVLLISDRFNAYELRSLVRLGRQRPPDPPPGEQPLAITPDGSLAPDVLYEASDAENVRYYLPRYELRVVNSRHTSRLRLRTADEDPHGPLGWLSIELIAVAPVDAHFVLRAIPHTTTLRLGYELAVQPGPDDDPDPDRAASYLGEWRNVDANTRGMTRVVVGQQPDGRLTLHGFGKCHPNDCDWGSTDAHLRDHALVGRYDFGFKTTTITLRRHGNQIKAEVFDDFTDADGRADRSNSYILAHSGPPADGPRPLIWETLGPLNPVGGNVVRCVVPFFAQADYDRIYQLMTDPAGRARLALTCHATVGQRSWQQWWLRDRLPELTVQPDLNLVTVDPTLVKSVRGTVIDGLRLRPDRVDPDVLNPHGGGSVNPDLITDRIVSPVITDGTLNPIITDLINVRPLIRTGVINRGIINTTLIGRPHSVALSGDHVGSAAALEAATPVELTIDADSVGSLLTPAAAPTVIDAVVRSRANPGRGTLDDALTTIAAQSVVRTLPRRLIVDKLGRPVVVQRAAEGVQHIAFSFDPVADGYIFDAPRDPAGSHVLFRHDLTIDGRSVTFFQDSLVRDQIYYEPQAFRLARSDAPPYLPGLLFAISDVVSEEEALQYRVRLAFSALPHVDGDLLLLARQTFGVTARFTALTPRITQLTLRVPSADGNLGAAEARPDAAISFDEGIADELTLDEQQFVRLAAAFQSPDGIGLQGMVSAILADSTTVDIPLIISLKQNGGALFDHQFGGPATDGAAGEYQVLLRNRIESPVRVNALLPVALGVVADPDGARAAPVVAQPSGFPPAELVAPGNTIQARYRVTPADAPVATIPPAVDAAILPDLPLLLGNLTVTEAFTEAMFSVQIAINPLFLGINGVTGVQVEIEGGPTVLLNGATLTQTVTLRRPLLARILSLDPPYRYRVTPLTDAGAQAPGDWTTHTGDLQIILGGA